MSFGSRGHAEQRSRRAIGNRGALRRGARAHERRPLASDSTAARPRCRGATAMTQTSEAPRRVQRSFAMFARSACRMASRPEIRRRPAPTKLRERLRCGAARQAATASAARSAAARANHREARPIRAGWCSASPRAASRVGILGERRRAQIFCASSRLPLLHSTRPACAAISGRARAVRRFADASALGPPRPGGSATQPRLSMMKGSSGESLYAFSIRSFASTRRSVSPRALASALYAVRNNRVSS